MPLAIAGQITRRTTAVDVSRMYVLCRQRPRRWPHAHSRSHDRIAWRTGVGRSRQALAPVTLQRKCRSQRCWRKSDKARAGSTIPPIVDRTVGMRALTHTHTRAEIHAPYSQLSSAEHAIQLESSTVNNPVYSRSNCGTEQLPLHCTLVMIVEPCARSHSTGCSTRAVIREVFPSSHRSIGKDGILLLLQVSG